jgi:hemerythrin
VDDFRLKYDACDEGLTAEVTIFLTNWLNEHLSIVNQEYIPFLKKAGKI